MKFIAAIVALLSLNSYGQSKKTECYKYHYDQIKSVEIATEKYIQNGDPNSAMSCYKAICHKTPIPLCSKAAEFALSQNLTQDAKSFAEIGCPSEVKSCGIAGDIALEKDNDLDTAIKYYQKVAARCYNLLPTESLDSSEIATVQRYSKEGSSAQKKCTDDLRLHLVNYAKALEIKQDLSTESLVLRKLCSIGDSDSCKKETMVDSTLESKRKQQETQELKTAKAMKEAEEKRAQEEKIMAQAQQKAAAIAKIKTAARERVRIEERKKREDEEAKQIKVLQLQRQQLAERQNEQRKIEERQYLESIPCRCAQFKTTVEKLIAEEKERGVISGFVRKDKLYDWAGQLQLTNKMILRHPTDQSCTKEYTPAEQTECIFAAGREKW